MLRYLLCGIGLSFGATCSTSVPPDRPQVPEIGPVAYQCDNGLVFDAWFGHEYARLQFFDHSVKLDQERAANGTRYSDHGKTLWIRGEQATLTLDERGPMPCHEDRNIETARKNHVSYRAVGQAPAWRLDVYRGHRFVLKYDAAQKAAEFPYTEAQHPGEGSAVFSTRSDAGALRIEIRYRPCRDTLSGQQYPDTVSVHFNDRTLEGCGRPL